MAKFGMWTYILRSMHSVVGLSDKRDLGSVVSKERAPFLPEGNVSLFVLVHHPLVFLIGTSFSLADRRRFVRRLMSRLLHTNPALFSTRHVRTSTTMIVCYEMQRIY